MGYPFDNLGVVTGGKHDTVVSPPSLPIPVFAAAVLLFLFLKLWIARGKLIPMAGLLAVCAVQTGIIALTQHYQITGMRFVHSVTAT